MRYINLLFTYLLTYGHYRSIFNCYDIRVNFGSKSAILLQREPVDPKFQVEGVTPDQPLFFSEN